MFEVIEKHLLDINIEKFASPFDVTTLHLFAIFVRLNKVLLVTNIIVVNY